MTVKRRARLARALLAGAGLVGGFVGVTLAGGSRAAAHPEFSALGTNRYVTAAVFDGRVDVTDALLEGTLASGEERRRLDTDGDGRISDAELRTAEGRMGAEAPALTVEVDGRTVTAPFAVAIDLGDEPRATTAPVAIERRASFAGAWPAGARRLRVVITREPPRLIDTELGVVVGPGLSLASGTDLVTFRGPRASSLEERAATFELTGPPPPPKPPRSPLPAVAAGLGALAIATLLLRRRQARG
jgi:hypothetical protein